MDVIDRRPVDAPFAGRILTTETNLVSVVCVVAPVVVFFVGFFGAIGAYHFGFEVKPPGGGRPALSPAVAGLVAGLGTALAAASLYFMLRYGTLPGDWYLRRVARREIESRPNRIGDPYDPYDPRAALVEMVLPEPPNRSLLRKPTDVGFLWIDATRREVLFEGDRERIRIPADGILTVDVFQNPVKIEFLVYQKFLLVVTCVHPTDLIRIAFIHRNGLGVLGTTQRRQRAMTSCEQIRSLIASQAPAAAADAEHTTPPKQ